MAKPKIVVVGAGSINFMPLLFKDFIHTPSLYGSTLVLVDIREQAVREQFAFGERLFEAAGAAYQLEMTTDRREALPGADFVVTSVEVDRFQTWRNDYEIPARYGIEQALGENGGPGGLFHALRMVPVVVEICEDVERLAPHALVLNLTNPLSRISKGIAAYTNVDFVGLCHEIWFGREYVSHVLDMPEPELDTVAAGLNHFTWFLDIRHRKTGKDLYPAVREAIPGKLHIDRLLTGEILRLTDVLCVTADSHVGEYIPGGHIWKTSLAPDLEPMAFKVEMVSQFADYEAFEMRTILNGTAPPEHFYAQRSPEIVVDIINAKWHDRPTHFDALNLPNRGYVANLPEDAIVEVPGSIDGRGARGDVIGALPEPMASWSQPQCTIHALTAKAAMEGDRQACVDALLLDPTVNSVQAVEACLDEMLEANRAYLPRFYR